MAVLWDSDPMSAPRAPIHREQIGPGLSVSVYEESVNLATEARGVVGPAKPVWVFASDGLESAGKREVVLGIVQVTPGALPETPFWLVSDLHRQAGADVLRDGGRFEIQGGSVDFDPRVNSFLCLDYALDDPRLPRIGGRFRRSPLLMLALLPDELQAADAFGNSRVVALLAKESCCHPFPWWHDPRRRCVVLPSESPSVLARLPIPRAETPDIEVVKTGPRLDIIVPAETCSRLHALLTAAPEYFALLTGVAPQARARLYWEPGQTAPSATISAASMPQAALEDLDIAGNFLMLVHGQVADEAHQREDGFVVMMAEPTWRAFTAAVKDQQLFTCRTEGQSISQVSLQLKKSRGISAFGEL